MIENEKFKVLIFFRPTLYDYQKENKLEDTIENICYFIHKEGMRQYRSSPMFGIIAKILFANKNLDIKTFETKNIAELCFGMNEFKQEVYNFIHST